MSNQTNAKKLFHFISIKETQDLSRDKINLKKRLALKIEGNHIILLNNRHPQKELFIQLNANKDLTFSNKSMTNLNRKLSSRMSQESQILSILSKQSSSKDLIHLMGIRLPKNTGLRWLIGWLKYALHSNAMIGLGSQQLLSSISISHSAKVKES